MKKMLSLLMALCVALLAAPSLSAQEINLTPVPYEMTAGEGTYTLPSTLTISCSGLDADMLAEADKLVEALTIATPIKASVSDKAMATAAIRVTKSTDKNLGDEGYTLKVGANGVDISATTPQGLYFALQTLKKLLPANVMAGKADASVAAYTLPIVDITDKPRYIQRGIHIDSSRHFHSVDQIKRMIDVMSYYKMNMLHWHLTDDQGWRVEVKKYPKLLEVATIAPNTYWYDFANKQSYFTNKPYGPYYYTTEELKEVVAYAAEHHIEVMPEIDMPGHMVAAIAAYPEFSCNPEGEHTIWYRPGVSQDVLNVANPAVVQFCKDVVDELADIFPCKFFHIGGDETPTSAWEKNADCQAMMKANGWTSARQLQSWFTKQIAEHIKSIGKTAVCWNEVVTASGAQPDMVKEEGILIYDWLGGGTAKAKELGLQSIYCNTYRYYLDYPQSGAAGEPMGMGGVVTVQSTYGADPDPNDEYIGTVRGVQGNIWCELIAEPRHMEYMALPRMIAIAETGWSPRDKKDFDSFCRRFTADTTLLNYGGYAYGRHFLVGADNGKEMPKPGKYYRLVTQATNQGRQGRCVTLVGEGSALISQLQASVGRLWTAPVDENDEWQLWTFELDPAGSGRYAMVCKAMPNGSVNPEAHSTSTDAQWTYDNNKKNYNFQLGEGDFYGQNGYHNYYSVRSDLNAGYWLNCAVQGNNLTVNCWSNPADGNGGLWTFVAEDFVEPSNDVPVPGTWYTLTTRATSQNRAGRVLELVREDSPLIEERGAEALQLWTGVPAATAADPSCEWQQWQFELDPAGSGSYALVCKAMPEGSVNPDAGSTSTDARWSYDANKKNYNFVVGEGTYTGTADGVPYRSIRSNLNAGYWINCGTERDTQLGICCWHNPADGDGGLWSFTEWEESPLTMHPELTGISAGKTYALTNAAADAFTGYMIADNRKDNYLGWQTGHTAEAAWTVESVVKNADNSLDLTLVNAATGRKIASMAASAANPDQNWGSFGGMYGYPVSMGATAKPVTAWLNKEGGKEITLSYDTRVFWPIDSNAGTLAGIITAGSGHADFVIDERLGGAWTIAEVDVYTVKAVDKQGKELATTTVTTPAGEKPAATEACPEIAGYKLASTAISGKTLTATYELTGYPLTYNCYDSYGTRIATATAICPKDGSIKVEYPEVEYYSAPKSDVAAGSELKLSAPRTIDVTYEGDAMPGVARVGEPVTKLEAGKCYLVYDAHSTRYAFRYANLNNNIIYGSKTLTDGGSPAHVWILEPGDEEGTFKVRNLANGLYIPALERSTPLAVSEDGADFTFTYTDGAWRVTDGTNYWDGNDDTMTGWYSPGHPYYIYTFDSTPYFRLTVNERDDQGNTLYTFTTLVRAGNSYIIGAHSYPDLFLVKSEGGDGLDRITGNKEVNLLYSADPAGIDSIEADGSADSKKKGIYDLSGRRLGSATAPGLYIIDGVKVLVK